MIGYNLHEQLNSSLREKQSQYSLIKTWLMMVQVALVYNEFENLKFSIQELSFI